MNAPDAKPWLFDLVTMIAVLVGLVYGGLELRQIRRDQQLQAVLALHSIYQSQDHINAQNWVVNELLEGVPPENFLESLSLEERQMRLRLLTTWESLGILVFRGEVPIQWVDEFFRFPVVTSWAKLGPHVRFQRQQTGYEGIGEWFQWLAERLEDSGPAGTPEPAYRAHRDWKP